MESINIKVDLTSEDVYKFQKAFILKRISPFSIIIICIIVFAIIANAIRTMIETNLSANAVISNFGILIGFLVIIVVVPFSLKRSSKRLLDTNKLLQKTQYYIINNDGIEISTESSKSLIKWNELYKAIEIKDSFQFYLSERQSYIIPKRYLTDNTEQLELMRSYLKNAPVPKERRWLFRGLKWGAMVYFLLFIIILLILTLYSSK